MVAGSKPVDTISGVLAQKAASLRAVFLSRARNANRTRVINEYLVAQRHTNSAHQRKRERDITNRQASQGYSERYPSLCPKGSIRSAARTSAHSFMWGYSFLNHQASPPEEAAQQTA